MSSRMDRYNNQDVSNTKTNLSRVAKNDTLYEEIKTSELSRVKTNNNMRVIESNGKSIDLDKIKKYLEENKEQPRVRRNILNVETKEEEKKEKIDETKEYDINSILEKAKRTREIDYEAERYKKLRDTQYDILSKIKLYNEENQKEEIKEDDELNTEEKTLVDLINTITIHKGEESLLSELIGKEDEETTLPIEKEKEEGNIKEDIEKTIEDKRKEEKKLEGLNKTKELVELKEKTAELDKSFYTNSMTFSKEDFEGFEELEKNVRKKGILSKVFIGLLIISVIGSLVFIVNYVFNLGLF